MKVSSLLLSVALSGVLSLCAKAQNKIMVIAHRGDWRNEPENSLKGFISAADMGVDMVELDLKKTKDGAIVILHDETLNRASNGQGKPADYTLEEIRKFRLKNALGRVTNNPIPTLDEVMLALKGRPVKVNLDKSFPYYNEAYAILKRTGTLNQALFKSEATYPELKEKYPELIDSITYMAVVNLDKPDAKARMVDYLQHMKPYAFEMTFAKDTSSILKDHAFITQAGTRIWINSLWASLNAGHDDDLAVEQGNVADSWDWIIKHGATMIQTDRPERLLLYLRKKHLHN